MRYVYYVLVVSVVWLYDYMMMMNTDCSTLYDDAAHIYMCVDIYMYIKK